MSYKVLLLLSILPSIILGNIIYQKDKVEKEPTKLLVKLFLSGIGSVILTLLLTKISKEIFPFLANEGNMTLFESFIKTFFQVALIEEFSKWIFLKKITWNNKEFNYLYDAIVYAVFVSLGFATIENILYVLDGGIEVALLRGIFSVPGHVFDGVFMGYYYGVSKLGEINHKKNIKTKNIILSLLIPTTLHFIFDFCLEHYNLYILIFYLIYVILLYINAFKKVNQISKITKSMIPQQTNISYCPNCGFEVKGPYCYNCGNKINNN
jgi:RsiW-degrading membrane proteinase PrsW (M82 family)